MQFILRILRDAREGRGPAMDPAAAAEFRIPPAQPAISIHFERPAAPPRMDTADFGAPAQVPTT